MDFKQLTHHALLKTTDQLFPDGVPLSEVLTKRLQFDVTKADYDEVEMWCSQLGLTKREFMQMALDTAFREISHGLDTGCLERFGLPFKETIESGIPVFAFIAGEAQKC